MSVSAEDGVRRRLSGTARRALIIDAALDAFASGGYGATGMAQIAELAGVTRAVLYDHFTSKRDLFLEALREQNGVFLGYVGAGITGEGSAEERMRATTDAVFGFAERHPSAWRMLFVNATHGDPAIDAEWYGIARSRNHAVMRLLANDFRAGGVDPASQRAEVIVEMLVGALTGAVEWRRRHRSVSRAEAVDAALVVLWSGLARLAP